MHPKRARGCAFAARATPAGIIESRSGNASIAPAPRSTARRERWRFVRKFIVRHSFCMASGRQQLDAEAQRIAEAQCAFRALLERRAHLRELLADGSGVELLHLDADAVHARVFTRGGR